MRPPPASSAQLLLYSYRLKITIRNHETAKSVEKSRLLLSALTEFQSRQILHMDQTL
jgi:hypothetical protein